MDIEKNNWQIEESWKIIKMMIEEGKFGRNRKAHHTASLLPDQIL